MKLPPPKPLSKKAAATSMRLALICAVSLVILGAGWVYFVASSTIVRAEFAFSAGDHRTARQLAAEVLRTNPTSDRALVTAGAASLSLKDAAAAKSYFERVSAKENALFGRAQRELGLIALNAHRVVLAESLLRKSLDVTPDDPTTIDQLIYLLSLEGRNWDAYCLVADRLRAGVVNANYLMIAGQPDLGLEQATSFARRCLELVPGEPLPRLALAKQAWRDNRPQAAREQLVPLLEKHPELIEAHALLALIIAETGTPDEFEQAAQRMPSTASTHPDVWFSRGLTSENRNQTEAAARCYWESLRLNPNSPAANYRLSLVLAKLQRPQEAHAFSERSTQLGQLKLDMASVQGGRNATALPGVVDQLKTLGRSWEAAGWCQIALQSGRPPDWVRTTMAQLVPQLKHRVPLTLPAFDPAEKFNLAALRLPTDSQKVASSNRSPAPPPSPRIAFQDAAAETGLHFTYQNGASGGDWESMLEMNGGGVAVLDYDGDHWPDIFFTQGGRLPPAPFDPTQADQLFRNPGGSHGPHFENVTSAAGLRDIGYGQGVTVGDFDNDGFSDLYVGNIGRNQLLRNNGDGTFSDVTTSSGTAAGGWTSSSVMADFNQDGLPDLYVVTYLGGEDIGKPCDKRVRPRCTPLRYPAEADQFYLNRGDGTFRDLSGTHGFATGDGRGLGVVAADFDGSHRLSLFVGNDMTPNFFFRNQTATPDAFQFEEEAVPSGLAFDHAGNVKACMGIAAGDYNLDGRLDLFVTNFYRQSNDLYAQEADGTFQDLSVRSGLAEPGFLMLGWGTQFLDADLDGFPDLVATNGHVHDPLDPQIPYAMPTQCFRNQGNGRFVEIPRHQLGPYFEQMKSGRALARLDWNRDGRDDVGISNLNEPAALLTNESLASGHFVSFRLVAINSARDAIGTRVKLTAGGQVTTLQLTAGDGFHASNERRMTCGIGENSRVTKMEVDWPSGHRQEFLDLAADQEWMLVEQHPAVSLSFLPVSD